jgi:hypothetical protein
LSAFTSITLPVVPIVITVSPFGKRCALLRIGLNMGASLNWLYRSYRIPPEWLPGGENAAHGNYANWADLYPVAVRPTR